MSVYDSSIPESKEERQKLTLGLNKSVIERAKAAGINISAITEHLLRAIIYDPNGNTNDDVIKAYEALFNAIRPLLIQYDTRIDVGKIRHYNDPECKEISYQDSILLEKVGLILYDEHSVPGLAYANSTSVAEILPYVYKPVTILENLIIALIDAAQKNRDKIKELEFALRFIRVLSDDDRNSKKNTSKTKQDLLDHRIDRLQSSKSANP